jgi:cell division protein FtsI/penicillin-binding protein 2
MPPESARTAAHVRPTGIPWGGLTALARVPEVLSWAGRAATAHVPDGLSRAGKAATARVPGALSRVRQGVVPPAAGPAARSPAPPGPVTVRRGSRTSGRPAGVSLPVPGPGVLQAVGRRLADIPRTRLVVAAVVTILLVLAIAFGGLSPAPSAEPTVQAFLLAWAQGNYRAAAALTTGSPRAVAQALGAAYSDLGAADLGIEMGQISQHGSTATAHFEASVDLGQSGLRWAYQGTIRLRRIGSSWRVVWSPAVIAPGMRAGDRLAVVTTTPHRAYLLDSSGHPLEPASLVYVAGVYPSRLARPAATATRFARVTRTGPSQVLAQIQAAPPRQFFELALFRPGGYRRLSTRLSRIPGLIIRPEHRRLFDSIAPAITGSVAGDTAAVLRQDGVAYRPGTTLGMSGLQAVYQRNLAGTPTTKVIIENSRGQQVSVLASWRGKAGAPVRTTINAAVQRAANRALAGLSESAAIVAVRPGTGQILAVAEHKVHGMPGVRALNGLYQPGLVFTIVSSAALLSRGITAGMPVPCTAANSVGGQRFTNNLPEPGSGPRQRFQEDFTHACATAFAGLSLRLTSRALAAAAAGFGVGARWRLPIAASSGSIQPAHNDAELALETVGEGSVRISPMQAALMAGVVQSGRWHAPVLVTPSANPRSASWAALTPQVGDALRSLMRAAVASGAGRAAAVGRQPVYGQVGNAAFGKRKLRTGWFAGYRGDVAFAVVELTRSASVSAAALAGRFLRGLPPGS